MRGKMSIGAHLSHIYGEKCHLSFPRQYFLCAAIINNIISLCVLSSCIHNAGAESQINVLSLARNDDLLNVYSPAARRTIPTHPLRLPLSPRLASLAKYQLSQ